VDRSSYPLFDDGGFVLELAVAADMFFTEGRPEDPRPALSALIAQHDWNSALEQAYQVLLGLIIQIDPAEMGSSRLEVVDDLVKCGLDNVWSGADVLHARVAEIVEHLERHATGPEPDRSDLLPTTLFLLGLSATMAQATGCPAPGDPIRALALAA